MILAIAILVLFFFFLISVNTIFVSIGKGPDQVLGESLIRASNWFYDQAGVQRTCRIVITSGKFGSSKYAVHWQGKEGDCFYGTYTDNLVSANVAYAKKVKDLRVGTLPLHRGPICPYCQDPHGYSRGPLGTDNGRYEVSCSSGAHYYNVSSEVGKGLHRW